MHVVARKFIVAFFLSVLCITTASAQIHTRLYACALANDDPSAFMGGSSIGAGLWTSDDSGSIWIHIGWSHVKCYSVAVVDSSFGQTLYLACGNGLMRSTDAGTNWRMLTDWKISEVMDVAINQRRPARLTIATATGDWTSIDSGEHWSQLGPRTFRPYLFYDSSMSTIQESNSTRLSDGRIASIHDDGGIWIASKQFVRPILQRGALWSVALVDTQLVVGGQRGIYSVDGINRTHLIFGGPNDVHALLSTSDGLIVGSLSGGLWRAIREEKDFRFRRVGIPTLQIWSLHCALIRE